jgi:hypothetical protein
MFFLHKDGYDDYFKKRYYLEANTNIEFVFVSYKKFIYSVWDIELQTGMGQTPGNVVFDPKDINFGIVPALEFRFPTVYLQGGLNHHCFHEIDRKDFKTVYWNKLFIAAGSKNMRLYDFWSQLNAEDGWTYANRVSWYATWGYYLRRFFGIVEEGTMNGENYKIHEAAVDVRFAFYQRKSWTLDLRGTTNIGYWRSLPGDLKDNGVFWRNDFSLENNFRRGKQGGMIFITYTLDNLPKYQGFPRFSKDRLLLIGVRFFI